MTRIPALHVVTDDAILGEPGFLERAALILESSGGALALHLRGPGTSGRALFDAAVALAPMARGSGSLLLVNDRVDVVLAGALDGAQLGRRSLPIGAARTLMGERLLGASTHDAEEAVQAEREGADFVLLGTIWESASHPGRAGAGLERVAETVARVRLPVMAIGGVTPERAAAARAAGASGVAVIRGVWSHASPARAVKEYLDALEGE